MDKNQIEETKSLSKIFVNNDMFTKTISFDTKGMLKEKKKYRLKWRLEICGTIGLKV